MEMSERVKQPQCKCLLMAILVTSSIIWSYVIICGGYATSAIFRRMYSSAKPPCDVITLMPVLTRVAITYSWVFPVLIFLCLFAFFVRLQKPFFKVFEWFVFTLALHLLIAWIAGFCFFSWRLKEVCVFIMDRILSSTIFLDSLAAPFRLH